MTTEVYRIVNGKPIEEFIAKLPSVQGRLHIHAQEIAAVARRDLADHKHDGHAFIEVTKGQETDYYVTLNDMRGQAAALSIEFGRSPKADGTDAMEGLYILHKAAAIPLKNTNPRRRGHRARY